MKRSLSRVGSRVRSRVGARVLARPDQRPMVRLPTLEARRSELEKCVFCPKLCRSACPVSNAEPRETVTPWGKMSMSYFAAHGDVPLDASHAAPAWACTGCFACRESCDHKNEVAPTLYDARAALVSKGVAPEAAKRTIERFDKHEQATRAAVRELYAHPGVRSESPNALLIGCAYARGAMAEARDAIDAASAIFRGPVALVEACCGWPLRLAGGEAAFKRQAETLARETARFATLTVVDAGCAMALRHAYAPMGVEVRPEVALLIERAHRAIDELRPIAGADEQRVRYHDPCQLGRGLGVYEAPRAVLARALGRAPDEFEGSRENATCSGAGGLLPTTMPEVSRAITASRLDEHRRDGGGRIVTACGSSLLAFRRRGAEADDIVSYIARAARPWRAI